MLSTPFFKTVFKSVLLCTLPYEFAKYFGQAVVNENGTIFLQKRPAKRLVWIDRFRGGAEGGTDPFFLVFSKYFWNVNITLLCIMNMTKMLYAQHVLKSEVFIRGGGGRGVGGLGPLFLNFLDPPLVCASRYNKYKVQKHELLLFPSSWRSYTFHFLLSNRTTKIFRRVLSLPRESYRDIPTPPPKHVNFWLRGQVTAISYLI